MDSEFFKMDLRALNKSTRVINSLMQHDRTAFTDLMRTLSKSLGSQASMMFTSREQENLQRARHLKRLAFVVSLVKGPVPLLRNFAELYYPISYHFSLWCH